MKTIKVNHLYEIPENYTGATEHPNGLKQWYLNDRHHREDGPAVIDKSGHVEYWLNGKRLPKKDINFLLNLGYPVSAAIKLVYFIQQSKKIKL